MNLRRFRAVAHKELLHIVRDARSLIAALAMPLVLLLLFGYALTLDLDRIPTYVMDQDGTPQSRELIGRFRGSRYFEIRGYISAYSEAEKGIDANRSLLAVVIPAGYARDLLSGREADVQLLLDGSDSNTASLAVSYAEATIQAYALDVTEQARNRRGGGRHPVPVEARIRVWYNPELKSRNYIIPGLIAVILMIIAAQLTSLTIAREWETGTMEQLLSTPVRAAELVFGKLSAFFLLGIADMLIAMVTGVLVFGVPLRGSVLLLALASAVFLFGALSWGILISATMRSQLLAYQVGIITSFLPAFLLSGFIFAIDNMPALIQAVTHIIPARYFVVILKGVFLKGVGVSLLWFELLLLAVYAAAISTLAVRKMRQKIA
jgi:ABC-2 type transport system permease protein